MNATRNNLPEAIRTQVVDLLNQRLVDAIDLKYQVKQAHWNLKGAQFLQLHELFDQIAGRLEEQIDDLAERAVQLGGTANGTIRTAAAQSSLPEYPQGLTNALDHAAAVADKLACHGGYLRQAIDTAASLGDADTADLFTEYSRAMDKDLWFVEAHLQ